MDSSNNDFYREIYKRTRVFYKKIQPHFGDQDFGFKILNGPPHSEPPVLFLGYQPGGATEDKLRYQKTGAHYSWPQEIEYLTEPWSLAVNVREIFNPFPGLLNQCVALNAIFFRAPSVRQWRTLDSSLRQDAKNFCIDHVKSIVKRLKPKLVIVNGFETLRLFRKAQAGRNDQHDLRNANNRLLTQHCEVEGYDGLATLHLSGARISAVDRREINYQIRDKIRHLGR